MEISDNCIDCCSSTRLQVNWREQKEKKRGVSESNREFIFIFLEWILRSGNSGFVFLHGFNDLVLVLSFLLTVKKRKKEEEIVGLQFFVFVLLTVLGFLFQ